MHEAFFPDDDDDDDDHDDGVMVDAQCPRSDPLLGFLYHGKLE